ncbi:DUF2155 domain-containing protein [Tritonibacter aquimaris]
MIKTLVASAAAVLALMSPLQAQETRAAKGTGVVLRSLDKVNGRVEDRELAIGSSAQLQGLLVTVSDCRYPADNPTGDAYAYLRVRSPLDGVNYFQGWMVASSPALNALDHNRYDVWVLRCKTS